MIKNIKLKLFIVFLLGLGLRFIGISSLPPALNRDEAAIGYNAYSLIKTAKDEHGQFLPLAFESIGDYKMPFYIYATVLPVLVFGLNEFSVRFWSALAGSFSVILLFYLVKELLKSTKLKKSQINLAAFSSAFLIAFNPWSIFYSRIGFEANFSLSLFLVGLLSIFKGFKKPKLMYCGFVFFLLAYLTYNSSYIFIPLFFIFFLFIWRRSFFKKKFFSPLILFVFFSFLIIKSLWIVSTQKSQITIFTDPTIIHQYNQTRTLVYQDNPLLARTWYNKNIYYLRLLTQNYLKSFSPKFLVLEGGLHPWHRNPHIGSFYYLEIVFAAAGLWWLLKKSNSNKLKLGLLTWLALAPLSSAITTDAPHSTRSLHLLPIILIFSGLGITYLSKFFLHQSKLLLLIALIYLANFSFAAYQYTVTYPQSIISTIPVGLKESINFVQTLDYKGTVYLTDPDISTYLYPLFYLKLDPARFQQNSLWTPRDISGMKNAYQYDRFVIKNYAGDIPLGKNIIIMHQDESLDQPTGQIIFSSGFYKIYSYL